MESFESVIALVLEAVGFVWARRFAVAPARRWES